MSPIYPLALFGKYPVKYNSYKETNAWTYKENNTEKLDIGAWDKNTSDKSHQPPYPQNATFNIHTHPGTRNRYGGPSNPSLADWNNYEKHPFKAFYILTRKHGLVTYGTINNVKGVFTPPENNLPKYLVKYRLK